MTNTTWDDRITTARCICGCRAFKIWIAFEEDGTLGSHSLDMDCLDCGMKYNIPTSLDAENDLR